MVPFTQKISDQISEHAFPYLLLLPALLITVMVLLYPLVHAILLSFTDYSLVKLKVSWVGLKNYSVLLRDPVYWEILFNSIFIVGASVVCQAAMGLSVALLLNTSIPLRGFFRGTVFLIWIIPVMVISLLWMVMFNADFGVINYLLRSVGLIEDKIIWLGKQWPARFALITTYSWWGVPYFMVMMLAALQTIPTTIIEAAIMDGAGVFQRFRKITLPHISHILLLCCLLSTVRLFQDITAIYILTSGGPVNATTTLAMRVFVDSFRRFQMGEAASVGVTWLILLFFLARQYLKLVIRKGQ